MGELTPLIKIFPEPLKQNAVLELFQDPSESHWTLDILSRDELYKLLVSVIKSYKTQCPEIAREISTYKAIQKVKPRIKKEVLSDDDDRGEKKKEPEIKASTSSAKERPGPSSKRPEIQSISSDDDMVLDNDINSDDGFFWDKSDSDDPDGKKNTKEEKSDDVSKIFGGDKNDMNSDDDFYWDKSESDTEVNVDNLGKQARTVVRKCMICNKDVRDLVYALTHMKKTHCLSQCSKNDELFMIKTDLIEKDPPYLKITYRLVSIDDYQKRVNAGQSPMLQCGRTVSGQDYKHALCPVSCKSLDDLNKHFAEQHSTHKVARVCMINQCPKCPLSDFKTDKELTIHYQKQHQVVKPFKCRYCDKTFKQNAQRTNHMTNIHIDPYKHECPQCSEQFRDIRELRVHVVKVHEGKEVFQCQHCPREFRTKELLKAHTLRVHKINLKRRKKQNRKCGLCLKEFDSPWLLKQHKSEVHGPNKIRNNSSKKAKSSMLGCEYCDKMFDTPSKLQLHIIKTHGANAVERRDDASIVKPEYSCFMCDMVFTNPKVLKTHISYVHEEEKVVY